MTATVLWNSAGLFPFPQQASRSELIPSKTQLSSHLGLLYVHFPRVEFRAEKPVVTIPTIFNWRSTNLPRLTLIDVEITPVFWKKIEVWLNVIFKPIDIFMETINQKYVAHEFRKNQICYKRSDTNF